MAERPRQFGFTLVELLTTVSIIALLVGILIPSLNLVRTIARETRQKAQFITIELALTAFRNDDGDYPESVYPIPPQGPGDYCGAQKLAEALVGWDLMGFHPDSAWRADGLDVNGGNLTYDPFPVAQRRDFEPPPDGDGFPDTLTERRGPYLETTNAFKIGNTARLEGLYNNPRPLDPNTYVLCDGFGVRRLTIGGRPVKAGTPILYFRANTSGRRIIDIYIHGDNLPMYDLGPLHSDGTREAPGGRQHPLFDRTIFYQTIRDQKITAIDRPYKRDSYILISAGADGLYGTNDDITNFGN